MNPLILHCLLQTEKSHPGVGMAECQLAPVNLHRLSMMALAKDVLVGNSRAGADRDRFYHGVEGPRVAVQTSIMSLLGLVDAAEKGLGAEALAVHQVARSRGASVEDERGLGEVLGVSVEGGKEREGGEATIVIAPMVIAFAMGTVLESDDRRQGTRMGDEGLGLVLGMTRNWRTS